MPRWRPVALVPFLLALAACGPGLLRAERVADGAEQAFEEQVGVRPDVTCPDDLEAEVGATGRCTANPPGDPAAYGVTVTVTKVDGDDATYAVEMDGEPQG